MSAPPTPSEDYYLEVMLVSVWWMMRHLQILFTGQTHTRHRRTETVLRRLTKKGKLRAVQYGKKLIYAVPRRSKSTKEDEFAGFSKVAHGLAVTECLVRFYRSNPDGTLIAEREFTKLGAVPEWGILYPHGTLLLIEFSTKHDFLFSGKMLGKLAAYQRNLEHIESKFQAKASVVFVVDVRREILERYLASRLMKEGPFFFTDYKTFLNVRIGEALFEPIYIWTANGKAYPLTKKHDRLENNTQNHKS